LTPIDRPIITAAGTGSAIANRASCSTYCSAVSTHDAAIQLWLMQTQRASARFNPHLCRHHYSISSC